MTEWYPQWQRNGWRNIHGEPVVNRVQMEELLDAMDGIQVKWVSFYYLSKTVSDSCNNVF